MYYSTVLNFAASFKGEKKMENDIAKKREKILALKGGVIMDVTTPE